MTKNMKVKQGFVKNKLADNYVVVATGDAAASSKSQDLIIKLNETASIIWDYVCQGLSHDEIVNVLTHDYDVTEEKASKDVSEVISAMHDIDAFI